MKSQDNLPLIMIELFQQIKNDSDFIEFIKRTSSQINFNTKNIQNLTIEKVKKIYLNLKQKLLSIESMKQQTNHNSWLQNQLRIFVFILSAHIFIRKISYHQLREQDFQILHQIFPNKSIEHLEYQTKLLFIEKNTKWTAQECKLFGIIMKDDNNVKKWNYIAKQLYIRSDRRFFKTPKQCRERWINYLDPSKIKGNWEKYEDLILLNSVIKYGKKWTMILKQLDNRRTQNSVKNRYNSLIKSSKKNYSIDLKEEIIVTLLIDNLKSQHQEISISMMNEGLPATAIDYQHEMGMERVVLSCLRMEGEGGYDKNVKIDNDVDKLKIMQENHDLKKSGILLKETQKISEQKLNSHNYNKQNINSQKKRTIDSMNIFDEMQEKRSGELVELENIWMQQQKSECENFYYFIKQGSCCFMQNQTI